ncbi:hypothetical protein A6E12_12565 [Aliivibrio fischeri]|uniref:hypothetical protein n=1 Tax=Aliivibrio fischeri TaxID=668 RepID=UPI00080D9BDB|nr:hypothetical protein [Aliivibrio fischeri]OCH26608.1 hypothetical protein A6E12_12565 [Aliivibrio fischeri]
MFDTASTNTMTRNLFTTAAVALTAVLVTGTDVADPQYYRSSVNERWVIQQVSESNEVSSQDMVVKVLSRFGLAVKDFESILGVKRAAIYNWKKGANEPSTIQFDILKKLYQIALKLNTDGVKIGRLAKTNVYENKSLLEKLSSPSIDIDEVIKHHKLLVAKVHKQQDSYKRSNAYDLGVEGDSFVVIEGKVT